MVGMNGRKRPGRGAGDGPDLEELGFINSTEPGKPGKNVKIT